MAKRNGSVKLNAKIVLAMVAFIAGLPIAIGAALQTTYLKNYASTSTVATLNVPNLNTGKEITTTINDDGTMGPDTYLTNYSATQPDSTKGLLTVQLASYDSSYPYPTTAQKGKPAKSNNKNKEHGPQSITSLKLTISKAEVHYAWQDASANYNRKQGKHDDSHGKWETLNITKPTYVDLLDDSYGNPLTTLGVTELYAGKYTEIRLYVTDAKATLESGETVSVYVVGKDKVVRIIKPFTIEAGKPAVLTLEVDKDHSVIKAGDAYILKPVVAKMVQG